MKLRITSPIGLNEEQAEQDVALRNRGFQFQSDFLCPWAEIDGHRHHALVYKRDDDCFCLRCRHAFRFTTNDQMREGFLFPIADIRVLEEIGQAVFPVQPGFRIGAHQQIVRET